MPTPKTAPKKRTPTPKPPQDSKDSKSGKKPMALILDGKKVAELLSTAASAFAMNNVLTIETAKDEGFFANVANFWARGTPRSLTKTSLDANLYRARRKEALKIYSRRFFEKMEESPAAALAYLRTKQLEIQLNRKGIAMKRKMANAVNDDVIRQLNLSINAAYGVQTSMSVLFVVVSGGAGLTFLGAMGAGVGYSIACSVAKTVAEGKGAKLVALSMMPAMTLASASGIASESMLKSFGKDISDEFFQASKEAHQRAARRLERIEQSRTRQARQGALRRARANVANTGRNLRNLKIARVGVKGLSSAVGILFMLPEIETAIKFDYAQQQDRHPSKRRPDLIGHAKRLTGH
ncbi:hypothetical protein Mal15_26900 [Stieleria maiorica]|uniref:Uncharacterized protein n=1 Tax=Stieleria maiorica TaxID=2795974 RepID=A0A5B9MGC1_9BACT|nr:hypothetical protein [Stieleria maiorica]QEF98635.1 hypothetical protein Mal15_26900 [Stieleria maiorica]